MKAPASKAAKTGKPTTQGAARRTSPASSKPGAGKAGAVTKAAAKSAPKASAKPAVKTAAKPAAKTPARSPAKASVKAPAKAVSRAVPKTPTKAVAKPAAKKAAKPAAKAAPKPAASKPSKVLAKAVVKAPAAKPSAKALPKTPSKAPAATKVASKAPVSQSVKPVPQTADKVPAAPKPVAIEPTPRPLGKRAAKKVMMEQMTQAEAVPTHAPDAAKATFSPTIARVMTPPVPSSVQKDPKRANNWKTLPVDQLTDQDIQAMPDSEYMGELQLAFFRRKLQQLKADMLANAGETTEHLREDTVVVPDPADRATIEEEHALELRTRDRERKLLKKIEQAIARIDSGDYGYCEETGEPIGVARLMARPTASLSLEAQQRRELKQKMFGD